MDHNGDDKEHVTNLERLVQAGTEQLREALSIIDELVIAVKPFRPELARKAVESLQKGLTTTTI